MQDDYSNRSNNKNMKSTFPMHVNFLPCESVMNLEKSDLTNLKLNFIFIIAETETPVCDPDHSCTSWLREGLRANRRVPAVGSYCSAPREEHEGGLGSGFLGETHSIGNIVAELAKSADSRSLTLLPYQRTGKAGPAARSDEDACDTALCAKRTWLLRFRLTG